jgi:hypothetical protein
LAHFYALCIHSISCHAGTLPGAPQRVGDSEYRVVVARHTQAR